MLTSESTVNIAKNDASAATAQSLRPPTFDGVAQRRWSSLGPLPSVLVLFVGAGVYAALEGPAGVTFYITPAFVGLCAVVAGAVGPVRQLIGAGLALLGWGTAVLLVHYSVISGAQTAPAYMVGLALGVLVARVVAPKTGRTQWMTAAVLAGGLGALGYFLEFDYLWLGRWPAWCLTLLAWGVYTAIASLIRPRAGRPTTEAAPV